MKKLTILIGLFAFFVSCNNDSSSIVEKPKVLFSKKPPVRGSSETDASTSANAGGKEPVILQAPYADENTCAGESNINYIALKNETGQVIYIDVREITSLDEYVVKDWSETGGILASNGFKTLRPGEQLDLLLAISNRPTNTQDESDFEVTYTYTYDVDASLTPTAVTLVEDLGICPED